MAISREDNTIHLEDIIHNRIMGEILEIIIKEIDLIKELTNWQKTLEKELEILEKH